MDSASNFHFLVAPRAAMANIDTVPLSYCKVREVQEALTESSRPDIELILGGTTFLTPDNMCELLLGDYGYV